MLDIEYQPCKLDSFPFIYFFVYLLCDYQACIEARIVVNHRKNDEMNQTAMKERRRKTEVWCTLTMSFCPSSLALSFFCMVRATAEETEERYVTKEAQIQMILSFIFSKLVMMDK